MLAKRLPEFKLLHQCNIINICGTAWTWKCCHKIHNFCLPLITFGYLWLHLVTFSYFWLPLVTFTYLWLPLVTFGYPWMKTIMLCFHPSKYRVNLSLTCPPARRRPRPSVVWYPQNRRYPLKSHCSAMAPDTMVAEVLCVCQNIESTFLRFACVFYI